MAAKRPALTCLAVICSVSPALAHPHIFVDTSVEIIADSKGDIETLKNNWVFDEVFSSSVILDFDANMDLKLDPSELKKLATTIYGSLSDYNYFTSVTRDGHDIEMGEPENFQAHYDNQRLSVTFDISPAKSTTAKGNLTFSVYDPTFYTSMDFENDDNYQLKGKALAQCKRTVVRPDADTIFAQNQSMMTESFFANPGGSDFGKMFAIRLELTCP